MTAKILSSTVIALLTLSMQSLWALEGPANFNFDGILLNDPANTPMSGPVALKLQIYDPNATCLLYEETQSVVALDANGAFSVKVGAGTRSSSSVDGGLAWKAIFSNGQALRSASSPNCTPGYTPANNDTRLLRVTVNGSIVLSPDFSLGSVPFATVADSVQGYYPTDFVNAAGGSSVTGYIKMDQQNQLRFSDGTANYVALKAPASISGTVVWALPQADGVSGQALTTDGAGNLHWSGSSGIFTTPVSLATGTTLGLGAYSGSQETSLTAGLTASDKGKMWFNNTTNSLMYWDGTAAQAVHGSVGTPGTVTMISAGIGLVGGTITSTGSFSVDIGTSANKIVQLTGSAQLPAVDGSLLTLVNAMKLQGQMVSSVTPSAGQILGWNTTLSQWEPQSMVPGFVNGGNVFGSPANLGTNDNFPLNMRVNGATRLTIMPTGMVGIGTTSPQVSLDLSLMTDSIRVPAGSTAQRPISPQNGDFRYNTTNAAFEVYENAAWTPLHATFPPRGMQTFTTSGSFTVPAGVTGAKVTVIGGAGGGYTTGTGGPGGAGVAHLGGLTPGVGITVTIGTGGTAGASPTTGTASSFGAYVIGGGGAGSTAGTGTGGTFTVTPTGGVTDNGHLAQPGLGVVYGYGAGGMNQNGGAGLVVVEW